MQSLHPAVKTDGLVSNNKWNNEHGSIGASKPVVLDALTDQVPGHSKRQMYQILLNGKLILFG